MKDILVAIDLDIATALIIKQVIELSGGGYTTIHLLHVYNLNNDTGKDNGSKEGTSGGPDKADLVEKFKQWKMCLQEAIPAGKVKGYLLTGMVHQCILEVAKDIKPQLIVIGKPEKARRFSFYKSLNADELSRSSKCPVLSVMNKDWHNKTKTILLPVRDFIPVRKIELLAVFAKIYRARIFLVAMQNNFFVREKEQQVLLETYRVLRNGLNNKVEYRLLKGNNFPRAIATYAEEIAADILIVNPKTETRVSSIFRTAISDILPTNSQLKILSVVPYDDM